MCPLCRRGISAADILPIFIVQLSGGADGEQLLEALKCTPDMDVMFQEDWE